MKVIQPNESFVAECVYCHASLQVEAKDVGEDMHQGGYFFNCCGCGAYNMVNLVDVSPAVKRAVLRENHDV